ncbi:MAG: YHS domain-containing protein [Planctomycetales bacterium]|nr:YHS domain-containing protein [Planctomycetales bacterium]
MGVWLVAATGLVCFAADEAKTTSDSNNRQQAQEALSRFNSLIGGWRGVGQPKRNSSSDAWSETAEWVWDIKKDKSSVGIRYQVKNGKLLETALLTYDSAAKQYSLDAKFTDKTERRYTGKLADGKLTLDSGKDDDGNVHQVVVTLLNDKRTLVLFQSKKAEQKLFNRVAEVGYTRDGTRLAVEGADGPECIVTGGKGTSSTTYKGKTYYFCCSGCRDAFNDDPDGIIAEALAKAAKKKAGGK